MPPSLPGSFGPTRQRGVVSILTALLLVLLITVLALVVDTGRLYLEQRNLQKVADMAALDASARLPKGYCADHPTQAQAFAEESAGMHNFSLSQGSVTARCVTLRSNEGLRIVDRSTPGAGVEVEVSKETQASLILRGGALFNSDFSGPISLTATASAQRNEPVAAFSIGSQLLRLNNDKLLGQLLDGVGLDVSLLTVLDANGIANASVTPAGLLKELGIDIGINELALLSPSGLIDLVDTKIGLLGIDELINASLSAVGDNVLSAALRTALSDLSGEVESNDILKTIDLKLLGTDGEGLIQLAAGSLNSTRAALESNLNLGELLSVALLTGTSQHAVELEGLKLLGIDVSASITEPPTLAVGPIGTTAYTGQVRLFVDIDTNNIPVLGFLTSLLGTRVHLPLTLDVTSAKGELTGLQCQADTPTADIAVTSSVLDACVGDINEDDLWSGTESCSAYVQETELITLFGANILSGRSIIPGFIHQETLAGMEVGETLSTQPNQISLGNTVSDLVASLLDLLGGLFRPPQLEHGGALTSDIDRDKQISYIAEHYLDTTKNSLGFYNVSDVTSLILEGGSDGEQELPPLTSNWSFDRAIPTTCVLWACSVDHWLTPWRRGSFSQAFHAYTSVSYGVLDVVGIPTLGNSYQSCAGLLSSLLNWNSCVKHNLTTLLKLSPDIENSAAFKNVANSITNPTTDTVSCSGSLCLLLRPLLNIVKPILNGVGNLVTTLLADTLGIELGRTDVRVESISCGVPTLVQ